MRSSADSGCGTHGRAPRQPVRRSAARADAQDEGARDERGSRTGSPRAPHGRRSKRTRARCARTTLRELFAADPARGERLTAEAAGLYLDYSKHRITDETLRCSSRSPTNRACAARIDAMFRGEKINVTENRAALHVALRAPKGTSIVVDGENVVPDVHAVLDRMADFADRVRSGAVDGPHRQRGSATSSTSASAAPTWAR